MGTWGFNILADDTAADVHGDYLKRFNLKLSHEQIVGELRQRYADILEDPDEKSIFWLAIAKAQWDCGALDRQVLARVREIVESGAGLGRWAEAGEKSMAKRQIALDTFLAQLQTSNPRPRKPRKPILRKPVFVPGDCLAIRLSDGDYAAALVLENPPEDREPGEDTYGINLIGLLDFKKTVKPTREIFEQRNWLRLTHHSHKREIQIVSVLSLRFRAVKDRFEVVAQIPLRQDDPKQERVQLGEGVSTLRFPTYSGWNFAEQVVHQYKWNEGEQ